MFFFSKVTRKEMEQRFQSQLKSDLADKPTAAEVALWQDTEVNNGYSARYTHTASMVIKCFEPKEA